MVEMSSSSIDVGLLNKNQLIKYNGHSFFFVNVQEGRIKQLKEYFHHPHDYKKE